MPSGNSMNMVLEGLDRETVGGFGFLRKNWVGM